MSLPIVLYRSSQENTTTLRFPLPKIQCSFDICKKCQYCCQECHYITSNGCSAPNDTQIVPYLDVCKSFPILIGHGIGRNLSLGIFEEQYPPEFGAFVPLGKHCMATLDERQRIIFQLAARWINEGKREFIVYEQCADYFVLITVIDPLKNISPSNNELNPTQIVELLAADSSEHVGSK